MVDGEVFRISDADRVARKQTKKGRAVEELAKTAAAAAASEDDNEAAVFANRSGD